MDPKQKLRKWKMADTDWSSLPDVALVKILSYVNIKDRLSASSTCKRWRDCLQYPSLWRNLSLQVSPIRFTSCQHMAYLCCRFGSDLSIVLHPRTVNILLHMMQYISENVALKKLTFRPCSLRIEWPERGNEDPKTA